MKAAFLFLTALLALAGCKKGEDDPFLSLRSRNKRLQQEWVLKEMTYYHSNLSNGYEMTDEEVFDGTTLVHTHTENDWNDQQSASYSMTLSIGKNGSYTLRAITSDTIEQAQTLPWNWVDTDKRKSRIYLADFFYTYLHAPLSVDRLTSRELILSGNFVNDQQLFTATTKARLVFERKKK